MPRFDTKGAAGILGANMTNGTFIERDRCGCCDDQPHRNRSLPRFARNHLLLPSILESSDHVK